MAGRTVTWLLAILVVTLFGMNGFLLFQLANKEGPKPSPAIISDIKPLPKDLFSEDDGKHSIRIAHLFLLHNEVMLNGAARILKRIWRPHHTYIVHMDIKADISVNTTKELLFKAAFGQKGPSEDNFAFIATQNVVWAGITMIQAEIDLLSAAFHTGRWWDQALLWSGRCYPTKTTDQIEQKLLEWKGKNILEMWGRGGFDDPKKDDRTNYVCVSLSDQMLPECMEVFYGRRGKGPVGIKKYQHGAQWFMISREFSYYALFSDLSRNLMMFMANTYVPDEMFFQTLLYNSPFKNDTLTTQKYVWRHEKWFGCEGEKLPCLMTFEDLDYAVKDTPIIARKFNPEDNTFYDFVDKLLDEPKRM